MVNRTPGSGFLLETDSFKVVKYTGTWPARPIGAAFVYWRGGAAAPSGMLVGDVWEKVAAEANNGYAWWKDTAFTCTTSAGVVITLGATPTTGSVRVFRRPTGQFGAFVLQENIDYTVAGSVVTLTSTVVGDQISIVYMYTTNQSPTAAVVVQVTAVALDTFTAADAVNALPRTTESGGKAWVVPINAGGLQPVLGIIGNQAYFSTTRNDDYAYIDAGLSDCTVQVRIAALGASGNVGLYLRAANASNGLTCNLVGLYKRSGAANTLIATFSTPFVVTDTMVAVLSGTVVKIYRQANSSGPLTLVATGTDSTFTANTLHGFRGSTGGSSNKFDDFRVTA